MTTTLQPLRTEHEHSVALAEASDLIDLDPAPGTPEADRLAALVLVIEGYEIARWPL